MHETKRRCKYRAKKIAWCNLLKKICNAPSEYETCKKYESKGILDEAFWVKEEAI